MVPQRGDVKGRAQAWSDHAAGGLGPVPDLDPPGLWLPDGHRRGGRGARAGPRSRGPAVAADRPGECVVRPGRRRDADPARDRLQRDGQRRDAPDPARRQGHGCDAHAHDRTRTRDDACPGIRADRDHGARGERGAVLPRPHPDPGLPGGGQDGNRPDLGLEGRAASGPTCSTSRSSGSSAGHPRSW